MPVQEVSRRQKGAATRERILLEARRILVEEGYGAVVMRQVATNANVKLGNLQYYFPTRDELLLAVIRQEAQSDLEQLASIFGQELDPHEALSQLVHGLAGKWRGKSGVVFATMAFLASHDEVFKAAYREIYGDFYHQIECAIELAEPGLGPSVSKMRARLLTALIDGAAMQTEVGSRRRYLQAVTSAAMQIALPNEPR